ncbi:biosynthetic peptidoglycan transglycosylase [Erysipelothrix urinaevulpis]|uniref:biosynthetic peptidoglycan transglycosylase n=1 Tax=Erysipelothrix urinaevulpis TaxID=2683717 RepID=UPI0039F121B9
MTSIVLGLLISSLVIYKGYADYKKIVHEQPIQQKIEAIFKSDNYVSLNQTADMLTKAIVTTEDVRFYKRQSPLDYKSIARAIYTNIKNLRMMEGASTIPQQVAKNLYFDHSPSMTRKVSEYFIAKDLMTMYTHDEVLSIYLNIIYFGDGYTGIKLASRGYFSKDPSGLNDFEATLLAGLPQAPSVYQLSTNYHGARQRQRHVLDQLVKNKHLSQEQSDEIFMQGE